MFGKCIPYKDIVTSNLQVIFVLFIETHHPTHLLDIIYFDQKIAVLCKVIVHRWWEHIVFIFFH